MSFIDILITLNQANNKIYFGPESAMTFFGRQVLADRPLVHHQVSGSYMNFGQTLGEIKTYILVSQDFDTFFEIFV